MYVGARSPETAVIIVRDATFDFTTVTGTELTAIGPGDDRKLWDWSLDASTPNELRLTHVFSDDGSDVPRAGVYRVVGWLLTASSRRRIKPVSFPPFTQE